MYDPKTVRHAVARVSPHHWRSRRTPTHAGTTRGPSERRVAGSTDQVEPRLQRIRRAGRRGVLDTNGNGGVPYVEPDSLSTDQGQAVTRPLRRPVSRRCTGGARRVSGYVIRPIGIESAATALAEVSEALPGYGPRGMDTIARASPDVAVHRTTPAAIAQCSSAEVTHRDGPALPGRLDVPRFPGREINVSDPGCGMRATTSGSQFDTSGLVTTPIATATRTSRCGRSFGTFVNLRVPYPLGSTQVDAGASTIRHGWKCRDLVDVPTRAPFHLEAANGRRQGRQVSAPADPLRVSLIVPDLRRAGVDDQFAGRTRIFGREAVT